MKYCLICFFLIGLTTITLAQTETSKSNDMTDELPYYEIPAFPDSYSAGNVLARVVDGLGFRYYWATEGLRPEDLAFKPNDEARTTNETLDHILGLTDVLANAFTGEANVRPNDGPELSFEQKRRNTLNNIKLASDKLKASQEGDLENYTMIFQRGDNTSEFPLWNLLNGPLDDALWHVGQVVSFRRSSGNPLNPKVSVFNGKLRD